MDLHSKPLFALIAASATIGVVALAGATSRSLIGRSPIIAKSGVGGERPVASYDVESPGFSDLVREPAPDRYAIETPEGRFEIGELRGRGVERNRRYSEFDLALAAERQAMDEGLAFPDAGFADREWRDAGGMPPLPTAPRFASPRPVASLGEAAVRVHSGGRDAATARPKTPEYAVDPVSQPERSAAVQPIAPPRPPAQSQPQGLPPVY